MRTVVVPGPISKKIGSFGLQRETSVRLFTRIHGDIPGYYDRRKMMRSSHDDRLYFQPMILPSDSEKHLFRFAIDDTTSRIT